MEDKTPRILRPSIGEGKTFTGRGIDPEFP
jgi:hypothetical protein